jgi:ribonuclease-3
LSEVAHKVENGRVAEFARRAGYTFQDAELLLGALTHSSYAENSSEDYQRLEFLGDRVLGLVISEHLYRENPHAREGDLARQLNYLVRKQTCAAAARTIDLESLIRAQTPQNGAAVISSRILGDACEAVIAAVYLDGGLEQARKFVHTIWEPFLEQAETATRDAKSLLQEWSLGRGLGVPHYKIIARSGPDHAPMFRIRVQLPNHEESLGEASSKRKAEQNAAQAFIDANGISPQ